MSPLLSIEGLTVSFGSKRPVRAVDGVDWSLAQGQTLGIVGESGSGKSVTAMASIGLLRGKGVSVAGRASLDGRDLLTLRPEALRRIRGRDIGMVFQDPMTSLNPVLTIGRQITEPLEIHLGLRTGAARSRAAELLRMVGIPAPELRLSEYPHRLSGGMRQRVMIAIAVACEPRLLIADEPTTALDVTIQAQILDLLRSLQKRLGMGLVLITHDLGVVAGMADRVAVMYAGRVVEEGPTDDVFRTPRSPYTAGLLSSIPRLDDALGRRLQPIRGRPPDARASRTGCSFRPRCNFAAVPCAESPPLRTFSPAHRAACHFDLALPGSAAGRAA